MLLDSSVLNSVLSMEESDVWFVDYESIGVGASAQTEVRASHHFLHTLKPMSSRADNKDN